MFRLFIFNIFQFVLISNYSFGQPQNEDLIRRYLDEEILFGEFQLISFTNDRLTKEEYDFRDKFRKSFTDFFNDLGGEDDTSTAFKPEDMTDLLILETSEDLFRVFDSLTESDIIAFCEKTNIDKSRFDKIFTGVQRFNIGWQDLKGSYQRSTWHVNSDGDQMVLYFYLNDNNEIIEYQEDFIEF